MNKHTGKIEPNAQVNSRYRSDIDGLRAIAVLAVIAFHYGVPHLRGGFVGVDIFFVISGYLITGMIISEQEAGHFQLWKFYGRRILRIFPALAIVLTFCAVVGWMSLFPDEYAQLGRHIAAGAGFVSNFILWSEVGYFNNAAELKPLLHLWSLAVEEQFYILWPLTLIVATRFRITGISIFFIGGASFALCLYLRKIYPNAAFYMPLSRFWELLAGGAIAYMLPHRRALWRKILDAVPRDVYSTLGLILIALSFHYIVPNRFPGILALGPVVGTCLIIWAGPTAWINRRFLSLRPMIVIGLISYPLYLWHWPLLSFLRIGNYDGTFRDIPVSLKLAALTLSFVLAWVTYRFIERPIRFGGRPMTWIPILAAGMTMLALSGLLLSANKGIPGRISMAPASASLLFEDYPHPLHNEACRETYPELRGEWACLLSKKQPATIALIGDSHAHQYYQSLAKSLPNENILNHSSPGCLPFTSGISCDIIQKRTLEFLREQQSIKTVILTGYFSAISAGFVGENIEGQRVAKPLSAANADEFRASAERMIGGLLARGKEVIVLRDIPDLVFSPRDCVSYSNPVMAFLRGVSSQRSLSNCGVSSKDYAARSLTHDDAMNDILTKFPTVRTFDPRPLLCNDTLCSAFAAGRFLYWNSDHLTVEGADVVIEEFVRTMGKSSRK